MGHWRTPDPGTSQVSLINPASRNWRRPCSGKLSSSSHNFLDDPGSQPQNVAFPGAKPLQRKPLGLRWQRCARRCTRPPWKSRFGWVFWSLQMRPPRSFVLGIGVRIHVWWYFSSIFLGWFGMVWDAVFCIFHIFHMHYLQWWQTAVSQLNGRRGSHILIPQHLCRSSSLLATTHKSRTEDKPRLWTWPSFEYGKPQR